MSSASDPQPARDAAEDPLTRLESLLAAAIRVGRIDADAEERAIAAFRAARDGAGRRSSRTRRRDDWRRRRAGRSLRAVFGALLVSLTLGGVAMASMGVLGTPSGDGHGERPRPQQTALEPTADAESASAPSSSGGGTTASESASADSRGRGKAGGPKNSKALCHAYASGKGRGHELDARAWRRLVDAAGGEASVEAYCDKQLASGKGAKEKKTGSAAGNGGNSGKAAKETAKAAKKSAVAEEKSRGKSGGNTKAEAGEATAAAG
ncbi:hypothetical protein ABT009_14085 [Streptomyces sp. NPDC002896]|uniref:hypothetical protein n=1 Tax=Streptomyces sp. NPDC002896 TaxID=3154438 RepID=UPI003333023C